MYLLYGFYEGKPSFYFITNKRVTKFTRETKRYGANRFLSEFPTKPWYGLSKPNWRRWWVGRAHQNSSVGRTGPAHYRYCSQAVAHSSSCVCQGKRGPLWAQAALTKNDAMPDKLFNRSILKVVLLRFPNLWSNASLATLGTTPTWRSWTRQSSCTVLVSTVTQICDIFAAYDASYLDIPLAEISYNSAVCNESYTQKLGVPLIIWPPCILREKINSLKVNLYFLSNCL